MLLVVERLETEVVDDVAVEVDCEEAGAVEVEVVEPILPLEP